MQRTAQVGEGKMGTIGLGRVVPAGDLIRLLEQGGLI